MTKLCTLFRPGTVALLLGLSLALPAAALDAEAESHPGYVDGRAMATLVDELPEDTEVVEITLSGSFLRSLTRRMLNQDPEVGELLQEVVSINAVILSGLDEASSDKARDEAGRLAAVLEDRGWERIARMREKGSQTGVYVRYGDDESVAGVTVLGYEKREAVFVNIAGRLDLARLAALGSAMDLPGLDAVEGQSERNE
jgi:hypothetical protein